VVLAHDGEPPPVIEAQAAVTADEGIVGQLVNVAGALTMMFQVRFVAPPVVLQDNVA
jgi:hypothetical protein